MSFNHVCSNCKTNEFLQNKTVSDTFEIRNDIIEHTYLILECSKCGELVSSPEENDEFLKSVYDKYKSKHGLLLTDEIISIRNKYGLSLRDFSKILGISYITYHRYEKGAIPDPALNNLLRLIKENPQNLDELFGRVKSKFKDNNAKNIQNKINEIVNDYLDLVCSECSYFLESEFNRMQKHAEMTMNIPDLYQFRGIKQTG
jgi:putative zinc finger/helix-turn-helix YgiT family protein